MVREHSPAHAPDHGAMSLHQGGECRVVPLFDEVIQELAIVKAYRIVQCGPTNILEKPGKSANRHVRHPLADGLPISYCFVVGVFMGLFRCPDEFSICEASIKRSASASVCGSSSK